MLNSPFRGCSVESEDIIKIPISYFFIIELFSNKGLKINLSWLDLI